MKKFRKISGQLTVREFLKRQEIASYTADVQLYLKPGEKQKIVLAGSQGAELPITFEAMHSQHGQVEFFTPPPDKKLIITSIGIPEAGEGNSNWNQGRSGSTGKWANWILNIQINEEIQE